MPAQWSADLCSCRDPTVCIEGCLCSCCQIGRQCEAVNGKADTSSCLYCLPFVIPPLCLIGSCVLRGKVVEKYDLDEGCCCTACKGIVCCPCSMCQTHNQLTMNNLWPGGACCHQNAVGTAAGASDGVSAGVLAVGAAVGAAGTAALMSSSSDATKAQPETMSEPPAEGLSMGVVAGALGGAAVGGLIASATATKDGAGGAPAQKVWAVDLCSCHDPTVCIEGCLCSCCLIGRGCEALEGKTDTASCLYCLPFVIPPLCFIGSCMLRGKVVQKFAIDEGCCCTACKGIVCCPCSMCQTHNHLTLHNLWPGGACCHSKPVASASDATKTIRSPYA